jgi:hypothetical protein
MLYPRRCHQWPGKIDNTALVFHNQVEKCVATSCVLQRRAAIEGNEFFSEVDVALDSLQRRYGGCKINPRSV